MRHSVLGNLAAAFRQSAMALVVTGCALKPGAVAPVKPASVSGPGRSAPDKVENPGLKRASGESLRAPEPEKPPTTLPLDGYEPAVIHLSPEGLALPLFVVAHGAGGQAGWHCHHYESMLGPAALLCVSGKRMASRDPSRGYYYPNHIELGSELLAARVTMLEHHGRDLLGATAVYIGYSQGATMGALAVAEHGEYFPLLALVEGGFDSWSPLTARRYRASGGKRILLVCGTEHCLRRATAAASTLLAAGLETQLLYARGAGHRPDGLVAARVREGLQWLLAGDERYFGVLEHLKELQ